MHIYIYICIYACIPDAPARGCRRGERAAILYYTTLHYTILYYTIICYTIHSLKFN